MTAEMICSAALGDDMMMTLQRRKGASQGSVEKVEGKTYALKLGIGSNLR
jgi:hypothetical protein